MKINIPQSRVTQQRGFSLIEVMVSSVLGLFLTAGALSLYSSNKDSYRIQQATSGTLKNSRFILDRLERKISSAGYSGFYGSYADGIDNNLNTSSNVLWDIETPVFGHNNVSSSSTIAGITNIIGGSDVLILKSMTNESKLISQSSNTTFTINTTSGSGYSAGNILVATDIAKATMFQIDSADDTVTGQTIVTLSVGTSPQPGNATLPTNSDLFDSTATIGTLETLIYVLKTGANGNTALFEGRLVTSAEADAAPVTSLVEIIPNVENIQYIYGIDTDGNDSIDKYVDASLVSTAEWKQVHTIGISLLLFSEGINIATANNSYSFDSTNFSFTKDTTPSNSADKRLRKSFTTYVTLKNL